MSDKSRDNEDEREMPPIPDGGLSTSMPEWLRRPPAWRTLPDREVVQSTPTGSGRLPEADTSAIDPREFIHDEDLPEWLRSLRRPAPVPSRGSLEQPVDVDEAGESSPQGQGEGTDRCAPRAFRPRRPPVPETPALTRTVTAGARTNVPGPSTVDRSWWEQPWFTLALGAALLIAVVVIMVILVA